MRSKLGDEVLNLTAALPRRALTALHSHWIFEIANRPFVQVMYSGAGREDVFTSPFPAG